MAQNTGTLVTAAIRPNDDGDLISTALDNEIKGGLHSGSTTTERDAIMSVRRSWGMLFNAASTGVTYQLKYNHVDNDIANNANWAVFTAQGSTGLQGVTGVAGVNGTSGGTGIQGATGISGTAGITGLSSGYVPYFDGNKLSNANVQRLSGGASGDMLVDTNTIIGGSSTYAGFGMDSANGFYRAQTQDGHGNNGFYFQGYHNNPVDKALFIGLNGTYKGRVGVMTDTPATEFAVTGDIYASSKVKVPEIRLLNGDQSCTLSTDSIGNLVVGANINNIPIISTKAIQGVSCSGGLIVDNTSQIGATLTTQSGYPIAIEPRSYNKSLYVNGGVNIGQDIQGTIPGDKNLLVQGTATINGGITSGFAKFNSELSGFYADDHNQSFRGMNPASGNCGMYIQSYNGDYPGDKILYVGQKGSYLGRVGINTDAPAQSLHILGASATARIGGLAGSGNRAVYSTPDGDLTNTASDSTLKTNVTEITGCLNKTVQLRPVYYNWIDSSNFGDQTEIGLIAQEVKPIIPEIVGVNSNGLLSMDYAKLTPILIGAIKELTARIEALESK